MDKDIFSLVTRDVDRMKLFSDLAQSKAELICKGMSESLCLFKGIRFNAKLGVLECSVESNPSLIGGEEYLGHFFVGGDKYYFQGKAEIDQSRLIVPVPLEIYHLQRRQNYRVNVPESLSAYFNIVQVNQKSQNIVGQISDLSSQGCRVAYKVSAPLLRLNDYVTGHLIVGKRSPIEIQGQIRHIKVDEKNVTMQTFGIEFVSLTPIVENRIFALTMEIHKLTFKGIAKV